MIYFKFKIFLSKIKFQESSMKQVWFLQSKNIQIYNSHFTDLFPFNIMRNNRIRNSEGTSHPFGRGSDILSPSSTSRNQIQLPQYTDRDSNLQKNDNMLQNMKIKFLLNSLIKKLKHLAPPLIVPNNVVQQWQNTTDEQKQNPSKKNQNSKQTLSEELSHRFQAFRHLNLLQGICIVLFCWIVTVSVVFRQKIGDQIYIITLILSLGRIIFLSTFAIKQKDNQSAAFLLDTFDDLASPALLTFSCGLFLIRCNLQIGVGTYFIEIIGIFTVIFQYKQLEINFRNIVKYAQQNRMKKQLRILELFMLIITLAHFFGLMLYTATYFKVQQGTSWIIEVGLNQSSWYIKYIYCLYWAITTMVTVGYGDLTPQNYVEVIFVMIVQLIGTAVFGYMINVIGITVDEIKKKNEQFDNYQETIDKLRDHYQLSRQLCHKMKYDIKQKQNEFKNIPLKTSEQKVFLDYIQPNLKEQFVLETNMRVIKKSIYFLTHFSVNFQNQIALKLIRIIYKPDQEIPICDAQQQSQRSMVIINSGCVNLYIEKNHNNISIMKKVREIKPSQDGLVMNVFGYSSLIMNRNIKLKALTQQTAVSYVLRRKDVLQCIDKSMLDFQSFNEMRQKMNLFKFLEDVEAPSLRDNQWHYIPNIFLIQKKITYENQGRLSYYRSSLRNKLKLITARNYQNKTIPKIEDQRQSIDGDLHMNEEDFHSLTSFETGKLEDQNYFNNNQLQSYLGKLRIDQCKVFQNFMKSSNLPVVALAYQKSCQKKSYRKRVITSIIKKPGTYMTKMLEKQRFDKMIKKQKQRTFFDFTQ